LKSADIHSSIPCNEVEMADFFIGGIKSEIQVSARRVMTWDKTKSRYDWKAIKLAALSEKPSN